jgi:hypothetical protein
VLSRQLEANPNRVRKIMALHAEKEELSSLVAQKDSIIQQLEFKLNQEKHARRHAEIHAQKLQEAFVAGLLLLMLNLTFDKKLMISQILITKKLWLVNLEEYDKSTLYSERMKNLRIN